MRLLLLFVLASFQLTAQVVDRYNFIQKPTDTSVTVAWRTASSSIGTIEWELTPGSLINSLSDPLATSKHHYDINGLTPNTLYYYQTSTDLGFTSDIDHFSTAKVDTATNFSFLHYGDCGYNNGVQNSISLLMEADSCDFGVVAGDVDQGVGNNYDDVFFGVYEDMLKNACHFTAIGNHDTYYDNADTYLDAFYLPTNNPQQTERYYTFAWGNAKFICMDSNIPYTPGTDQYDWLVDELSCNPYQWMFVFFHHPPWTNAWSADYFLPFSEYFLYQGNEDMRTDIVPLFEQYGVDFVLNGHSHCYQRGELNGVKYVISGGAGSATIDFNTNSNSPNIDTEIYVNQYVRFNVDGDTVRYVSINDLGATIDSVTTIKVNTNAAPPVISYSNGILSSTVGTSYTWYLDGVELTGVTSQSFTPTQNGTYIVEITNANGCILSSESFLLDNNSLNDLDQIAFNIYPNPSNGTITLSSNSAKMFDSEITITNALGQVVYSTQLQNEENLPFSIDLENEDTGMYFLKVTSSESANIQMFMLK